TSPREVRPTQPEEQPRVRSEVAAVARRARSRWREVSCNQTPMTSGATCSQELSRHWSRRRTEGATVFGVVLDAVGARASVTSAATVPEAVSATTDGAVSQPWSRNDGCAVRWRNDPCSQHEDRAPGRPVTAERTGPGTKIGSN